MAVDEDRGGEAPCLLPWLDEQGRVPDGPDAVAARIQVKRAYEPPADADGYRVLVDRLWPRGVKRESARIDAWARELAPSDALRRWFGHDPARWDEFCARYNDELAQPERGAALADLLARAHRGPLTLVYGARDEAHNNAVALRAALLALLRAAG